MVRYYLKKKKKKFGLNSSLVETSSIEMGLSVSVEL
jgi:hypothetical protein